MTSLRKGAGRVAAATGEHGLVLRSARRQFYLDPALLGYCLVEAFYVSLFLLLGRMPEASAALSGPSWLGDAMLVVMFGCVALGSSRIAPLSGHRRVPAVAALLACAGSALYALARTSAGPFGLLSPVAGVVVLGALSCVFLAGYVVLSMCWLELYAKMDLTHVIAYFALANLGSAVLSYLVQLVRPGWLALAFVALMPAACALLYRRALAHAPDMPFMQGERSCSGWSFPLRPIVLLATFTFANYLVRSSLPVTGAVTSLLGVVAASVFAVLLEWLLDGPDIRALYSLSLPLVVAAALCVLVPAPGFALAGALLSNAAYALFSIFALALLGSLCFRFGVEPLWLFGFAQAAVSLGTLLCNLLTSAVDLSSVGQTALTVAVGVVILAFVCLYVLIPGGSAPESWGIRLAGEGVSEDSLEDRCARLARQRGLTRREEEVLVLMARGATLADMEETLGISNSTLKTHAHHVYVKLGVSGKGEAAQLVASRT